MNKDSGSQQKKGFTPGPWEVRSGKHTHTSEYFDEGETWFNVTNEDGVIADVLYGRCLDIDEEEAESNAYLIASAPEMYAELAALKAENEELKGLVKEFEQGLRGFYASIFMKPETP